MVLVLKCAHMMTENLRKIQYKVGKRASIVAVTKGRDSKSVRDLYDNGLRIFGENRVQEASMKFSSLEVPRDSFELHMIGHLQTNKVREAVALFDMIQSVSSLRLLREIEKESRRADKVMKVLVQVNVSKDPKKYGIMPDEVFEFFRNAHEVLCSPYLRVEGLMTIVEHTPSPEDWWGFFKEMK